MSRLDVIVLFLRQLFMIDVLFSTPQTSRIVKTVIPVDGIRLSISQQTLTFGSVLIYALQKDLVNSSPGVGFELVQSDKILELINVLQKYSDGLKSTTTYISSKGVMTANGNLFRKRARLKIETDQNSIRFVINPSFELAFSKEYLGDVISVLGLLMLRVTTASHEE